MSIFPDKTIREVLGALDTLQALKFINYRTDTVQEIGDTIKCFCPLHKEQVFRTLVLSKREKSYRCMYSLCPGNKGGDLIDLYSKLRDFDYDDALQELVDKLHLRVALPPTGEVIKRTLEEGENFLYLITVDEPRREMYLEEAHRRFQRVLEADAKNAKAMRGLYQVYEHKGESDKLAELSLRRIDVEAAAGRYDEVATLCGNHLALDPDNLPVRKVLADALLHLERNEEAMTELMAVADMCEVTQDFDGALDAYRKIEKIDIGELDVHPMIINLLITSGRQSEAVEECVGRADWLVENSQIAAAIDMLRQAVDVAPDRDDLRARIVEYSLQLGLTPQRINEALALVDDMIARESLDAAGLILHTLCEADPQNPMLLDKLLVVRKRQGQDDEVLALQYRLSDLYRDSEDFAAALLLLEEILATSPEDIETLKRIAEIHRLEGDGDKSIEVYGQIVELATRAGDIDEAIAVAEWMSDMEPEVVDHRELVIDLLIRAERVQDALQRIQALVEQLETRGDTRRQIAQLRRALGIAPARTDLMIKLAESLDKVGDKDDAIEQRMRVAERFISIGEHEVAIDHLRLVLDQNRDHLRALSILADALIHIGHVKEAHSILRKLSDVHIAAERYDEARDTLERLLAQNPEDVSALELLTDVYTGLGNEDMVVRTLERLAAVHQRHGQWSEMLRHTETILTWRPDSVEAHRNLVLIHDRLDHVDEVPKALRRLAEIHKQRGEGRLERDVLETILQRLPDDRETRRRLVHLLLEDRDRQEGLHQLDLYIDSCHRATEPKEACSFLRELIGKDSEEPAYHERLIGLLKQTGTDDEVIAQLRTLIGILTGRGDLADVVHLYRDLLNLRPDDIEQRASLIQALRKLDRNDEAIDEYLLLAGEHERSQRMDEAEQICHEILALRPEHEVAHRRLVKIARAQGRNEKAIDWLGKLADFQSEGERPADAIETLREVFDIDPMNIEAHRRIVRIQTGLGNIDESIAELRTIVEIHRQTGELEAAIGCQREAIEISPSDSALRHELVKLLVESDDTQAAIDELLGLAEVQAGREANDEVLTTLAHVLEISPNHIRALKMRAETYLRMGDEKKALQEYLALSAQIENPEFLQAMAKGRDPQRPAGLPLIEDYTFESFVVGDRNNFAYATALATAKAPAKHYNPLFLHSDVGLGKTHLLQAIANFVLKNHPDWKILYTTSEEFVTRLIEAIQENTVHHFRQAHRDVDFLLLDDVQFLAEKERAQEEFFHIFNTLFQAKKQIVITSDRPPKDIAHLEKRLKSRFGAGVVVDIQAPDVETRSAIIRRELQTRPELKFPPEAITLIAGRIETNVRELKGAVNQIDAAHTIAGEEITVDLVNRVLDQLVQKVG